MTIVTFTTLYIVMMNLFLAMTLMKLLFFVSHDQSNQIKAIAVLLTWFVLESLLIYMQVLPVDMSSMILFSIILIAVILAGVILSPLFQALLNMPQEFLLLPQAFRMFFGAGFIIEAAFGIIPLEYGVLDGVLHITTAFLATTLAIIIAHGVRAKRTLIAVNFFGLLDIVVVAYGIAFFILDDIGTEHNVFYAVFFAAPIFIWLHLISLFKVYKEGKVS